MRRERVPPRKVGKNIIGERNGKEQSRKERNFGEERGGNMCKESKKRKRRTKSDQKVNETRGKSSNKEAKSKNRKIVEEKKKKANKKLNVVNMTGFTR